MRVSVYAQISLKDRPEGYLGMTGESLSIGKNEEADLYTMMASLLNRLAGYYGMAYEAEELNKQLDKLSGLCHALRFKEVE